MFLYLCFKGGRFLPTTNQLPALIGMGFFFGVHWLFYFLSIKLSTASIAVIALASYGIHLLILGWIFRNTKPSWFDILALSFAIFGTLAIIPEFSLKNNTTLGVIFGLISAFCFACLPILHQKYREIPTTTRASGQFFFAMVFFLFFLPLSHWDLPAVDWAALIILAVLCTFIAHSLWIKVTSKLSTLTSSLIYYLIIPISMLLSHFFLDEVMTISKLSGGSLILLANVIGIYSQWKRKSILNLN